jgi:hypothetical protein
MPHRGCVAFHLFTLMRIRIQLFTLMRIRIQLPKMMQIHADADPDPQHWKTGMVKHFL